MTGEDLKMQGILDVADHNPDWMTRAMDALQAYVYPPRKAGFTSDDFREWWEETCYCAPPPPHPNLYGALFLLAAKRNLIRATDLTRKSTRKSAHGRRLVVWESV